MNGKDLLFDGHHFKGKVLIIGAGAAGLYAGFLLKANGVDFRLLEAAERYGGRLGKLEGFADFPLDRGAEWLHGKKSRVGDWVRQTNTAITKDESETVYWHKNELKPSLPVNIDRLFRAGKLPDLSYADYARRRGLGEDYKHILEGIAGDQGASASKLSAYWSVKEFEKWNSGGADYKFAKTYYDLIDQNIAQAIRDQIQINSPVTKIEYSRKMVVVTAGDGETAIPGTVLNRWNPGKWAAISATVSRCLRRQ